MKQILLAILILNTTVLSAQSDSAQKAHNNFFEGKLSVAPAIGIKPWPTSDLMISNLVEWNLNKRFALVSHSSYAYNDAFQRTFNFIKTAYNYTLSQKFGFGIHHYSKRSVHTWSLLAGIKYDSFKETLDNPEFEKVTAAVNSTSPDLGLMYDLKVGRNKYYFTYRMIIPLYPYPFETTDLNAIDGNFANITMEFGVGIRIK